MKEVVYTRQALLQFEESVKEVVEQVYASDAVDVDELKNDKLLSDPSRTVGEELVNQIATIGENITIRLPYRRRIFFAISIFKNSIYTMYIYYMSKIRNI